VGHVRRKEVGKRCAKKNCGWGTTIRVICGDRLSPLFETLGRLWESGELPGLDLRKGERLGEDGIEGRSGEIKSTVRVSKAQSAYYREKGKLRRKTCQAPAPSFEREMGIKHKNHGELNWRLRGKERCLCAHS